MTDNNPAPGTTSERDAEQSQKTKAEDLASGAKGKDVIRVYHHCRAQHGGANGRCPNRVLHYRCHEGDRQKVPGVQYDATVVCRRGGNKIVSTYTQNI